jgi:hypothetical protein
MTVELGLLAFALSFLIIGVAGIIIWFIINNYVLKKKDD